MMKDHRMKTQQLSVFNILLCVFQICSQPDVEVICVAVHECLKILKSSS